MLSYYLSSRDVDDFDKLCDLLISDQPKSVLPNGPLNYVLFLEGEAWFAPDRVTYLADTFVNNQSIHGIRTSHHDKSVRVVMTTATNTHSFKGTQEDYHQTSSRGQTESNPVRCYVCDKLGHVAKNCSHWSCGGPARGNQRRRWYSRGSPHDSAHVSVCAM